MGLDYNDLHILARALLNEWQSYQIILRTLLTKCHEQNMICKPEESYMYGEFETLARFITTYNDDFLHPKLIIE